MGINFGNMSSGTSTNEVSTPAGAISLDLTKGSLLDLTKREPGLKNIIIGAGWDANDSVPAFDLDVSAFALNFDKKITSGADVIFFNNRTIPGVALQGDNTTGSGEGDDEQIFVTLDAVSPSVYALDIVINIYEARQRHQTFGMVKNSYIRVVNKDTGNEICRYPLREDFGASTAVIAGRLKRSDDGTEWQFEAIGEGKIVGSLNDIAALYM